MYLNKMSLTKSFIILISVLSIGACAKREPVEVTIARMADGYAKCVHTTVLDKASCATIWGVAPADTYSRPPVYSSCVTSGSRGSWNKSTIYYTTRCY